MANKREVIQALEETGVVAILRMENSESLSAVAKALCEGGIKLIEITMTVPGALEILRDTVKTLKEKDVYIGMGTVLDVETARLAILSGAAFIVGPGFDKKIVAMCRSYNVLSMPGAFTPSEIITAWKGGADIVKVFPAKIGGGPDYIRIIKEPLPQIALVPTNGVNFETATAFIKAGALAVGAGSCLVNKTNVAEKEYEKITANARKMIEIIRAARREDSKW
jgi:2-dehydro-3-deoxyphosphogluconate aldolase/(4S)-4-hydroxy-2-oxoglutarate aldolase